MPAVINAYMTFGFSVPKCNCLPSCTSIEYNTNIDRDKFSREAERNLSDIQLEKLNGLNINLIMSLSK